MNIIMRMLLTLSFLGVIAGGSLALVNNWSSPIIAENQRVETERGIFMVQPAGKTYEKVNVTGYELYKVFDEDSSLIGYSLVYQGNGFQGKIRLIAGLTPDINEITSLEILDQVETPGLGTKITEDPFKDQFKGLNVSPSVKWVKGTPPTAENEIQAITGATISSKSIVEIINAGVEQLRKLKEKGGIL
jgi:Na+-translocating ferredoxin:NAD+ oxidoreductase subunit G